MSNSERIYRIDQLLNDKKLVTFQEMLNRLEISPATLKRDLAYMRDRLNAPIVYDKERNGYCFDSEIKGYALPGLWFSPEEIFALLTMQHLLTSIDNGGMLSQHIKPLQSRLLAILDNQGKASKEIIKRVKIETVGARKFIAEHFQEVGLALVDRKKLLIEYYSRSKNEITVREISPQVIIYHRNNWYLFAWCHSKNSIRSFSVDSIKKLEILDQIAIDIDEVELNEVVSSGYGVFSGKDLKWAKLRFDPRISRWVGAESWHQNQLSERLQDGSFILTVPYSDLTEITMDILRYGSSVEVIEPLSLRENVKSELSAMRTKYDW